LLWNSSLPNPKEKVNFKYSDRIVDVSAKESFRLNFNGYFEETKELERIKTLINQVKELIDISPLKFKTQLISNYNQIIARYYILANIHLNLAEQEFSKIFRANFPKFNVVVNVYYLGLIAYKQTDYKRALEYFRSVAKNGNKLSVVKKANEYIEKINEEIRKEF